MIILTPCFVLEVSRRSLNVFQTGGRSHQLILVSLSFQMAEIVTE
ncbi:MAG: hypothetical protein WBB28_27195 [Crinalium sp.]